MKTKPIFSLFTAVAFASAISFSAPIAAKVAETSLHTAIQIAYTNALKNNEGKNADYIPALAKVNPKLFGISVVTVDGAVINTGEAKALFSVQSISKVFTLALAMKDNGSQAVFEKVGVNATGLPFNSALAIELNQKGKAAMNPLVNAGALATTSLVKGKTADEKYQRILAIMSEFAGRKLTINQEVYGSEAATNQHNQAIAVLLQSYNRLYDEPMLTTDAYTMACSINVNAHDLAVMGSILANNGIHPVTKKRMLTQEQVAQILAIMATNGLYDTTGDWLFWTGLPGKSGVGGGILAVVPGKMAIAVFSPPLDETGNSVRGQQVVKDLVKSLHLNMFNQR